MSATLADCAAKPPRSRREASHPGARPRGRAAGPRPGLAPSDARALAVSSTRERASFRPARRPCAPQRLAAAPTRAAVLNRLGADAAAAAARRSMQAAAAAQHAWAQARRGAATMPRLARSGDALPHLCVQQEGVVPAWIDLCVCGPDIKTPVSCVPRWCRGTRDGSATLTFHRCSGKAVWLRGQRLRPGICRPPGDAARRSVGFRQGALS
jgi:hypothetical protein